ncbi:hypothetical protein F5Y16DRAFT_289435 [Xylariaceae sp. FL0255]|nr:hypothetical protein F5Y16DRAFT_289435 [Xylariaceae sp. FL0255]
MSQSLSARERSNPPPRQKSCTACIKSKRRCSLGQPSCLRCSQRRLKCTYPSVTKKTLDPSPSNVAADTPPALTQSNGPTAAAGLDPVLSNDSSFWDTAIHFNSMDLLNPAQLHPACPTFPSFSFNDSTLSLPSFMMAEEETIPRSISPSIVLGADQMELIVRSPKAGADAAAASMIRMRLLSAASALAEKRLSFAIDAFRRVPTTMVRDGGTMCLHPRLFRDSMPDFLEDALSMCALHVSQTTTNTTLIQRMMVQRYHKLLSAPIPRSCGRAMVARTHALLLYQTMLYFSPSSHLRSLAQETESILDESAMILLQRHHDFDSGMDTLPGMPQEEVPLYPPARANAFFDNWVYQESARRTGLAALFFVSVVRLFRGEVPEALRPPQTPFPPSSAAMTSLSDADTLAAITTALETSVPEASELQDINIRDTPCDWRLLLCQHVTLSAHLWHARDAVDFAIAWCEHDHLLIRPSDILDKLLKATPDNIDEFGRVLMTSATSVEHAKAWFASKGGSL